MSCSAGFADEEAFVIPVGRYQQPTIRLACSMVPSQPAAEEAVEDTWLGAVRGIGRCEARSSFKTWTLRILINRVRSRSAPRNLPIPPSRRSRQLTRPASVLTASGPIPSSVEQRRARTVSTPSPGTDPQIWRRRTACTSGPGRHIARRRGSLQRRRARRAENQRRQPAALAAPGTRTLAKDPRPRD